MKHYTERVNDWMLSCFGPKISSDITERNHRFIEEALELIQATGATASECHQLVDYVFGRESGEMKQEIGGVMVTLAALCNALGINMNECGEVELERIWKNIEKIRAKQAVKPKHSPLPALMSPSDDDIYDVVRQYRKDHPERFKMPTDDQVIKFALVFNDGKVEHHKLADMVGFLQMVIDRLYENGDILIPSSKEE